MTSPDGKKSDYYKINGSGESNITLEQIGEHQLCFEMDIPSDDYEKKLREQRRMARRVDISISTNSELQKQKTEQKDETFQKAQRLNNKVVAAKS